MLTVAAVATFDFDRLQRQLIARFGEQQLPLLRDWQKLLAESRAVAEKDKLKKVTDFFNRRVAFDDAGNLEPERISSDAAGTTGDLQSV